MRQVRLCLVRLRWVRLGGGSVRIGWIGLGKESSGWVVLG
jgi:hypothetical protein